MSRSVSSHVLAAGLVLLCLAACAPAPEDVELRFAASWGGRRLTCAGTDRQGRLADLRFYVSELTAVAADGREAPVALGDNGRWQGGGLALVDLEDGSGDCHNGTPDTNAVVLGRVALQGAERLRFTLGVPFVQNHADPLRARAPLDDSTMHWHWRTGYQFLRVAGAGPEGAFRLHVGSADCAGPAGRTNACRYPNRVRVELSSWRPGATVEIDLRELALALQALDPGGPASCESGPADPACRALWPVLGLDPANGRPTGEQRLLRISLP